VAAVAGFSAIMLTSGWESSIGSLIGFTGALAVWGFVEMLFLMGVVVGSNAGPAPIGERGWPRFRRASLAIAHHEALLVTILLALALVVGAAPNPIAFWTFALLWAMRMSTKLNIFFGVPNTAAELLPARLSHLRTHFRTSRPTALYPISLLGAAVTSLAIYVAATAPDAASHNTAAGTLLLTFALLGLLEHLFLIAPFATGSLWGLGRAKRDETHTIEPAPIGPANCQPSRHPGTA
jgi:putative photosynthetic complex assembly protein 2